MFIAMNRFKIGEGHEAAFEERWRNRHSRLGGVSGFQRFWLLRDGSDFISMSQWESREAFVAWTQSDAFPAAHSGGPPPTGMYLGAPVMTGYEVVLSQAKPEA
jgi:heme-degrading monooxygenase HmoA